MSKFEKASVATKQGGLMKEQIVIDESRGLVFETEDELYDHFLPQIQTLEKEYFSLRAKDDIAEKDFAEYESLLNLVLDEPDEIWEDATTIHGFKELRLLRRARIRDWRRAEFYLSSFSVKRSRVGRSVSARLAPL
jgi:hypothetical protein